MQINNKAQANYGVNPAFGGGKINTWEIKKGIIDGLLTPEHMEKLNALTAEKDVMISVIPITEGKINALEDAIDLSSPKKLINVLYMSVHPEFNLSNPESSQCLGSVSIPVAQATREMIDMLIDSLASKFTPKQGMGGSAPPRIPQYHYGQQGNRETLPEQLDLFA